MLFMEEVERERFIRHIRVERKRKEYQRKLLMRAKILTGILAILLIAIGIMM